MICMALIVVLRASRTISLTIQYIPKKLTGMIDYCDAQKELNLFFFALISSLKYVSLGKY